MERDVPSIVLIHLIVFGTATLGQNISMVVYITDPKTWWDAQAYCKTHHTDLVTIRDAQQADKFASYKGWIGLHHYHSLKWKWSKGHEFATYIPGNLENLYTIERQCVISGPNGTWEPQYCGRSHPFLCTDEKMILIEEKKTWEGALLHCAVLHDLDPTLQNQYALANLSQTIIVARDTETMELNAITDEVWVLLRFLAGNWLWMSKDVATRLNLPTCPTQDQSCGALPYNSTQWKLMNCNEKRKFICHQMK